MFFGPTATDSTLDEFCADQGQGSCYAIGHPSQGGVPFVAVHVGPDVGPALERAIGQRKNDISFLQWEAVLEDIEPDELEASLAPEAASIPWGLERIGVPNAGMKGKGVNIYVLDGGVRVTHQDFGGRAIPTLDAGFQPPKVCAEDDTSCAADDRGHGTHCAGSAGGASYGVAPEATIRAMDRGSSYADAFVSMDWAILNAQKPAVLTMSFGSGGQDAGSAVAMDAVIAAGLTVTVAAGNNNFDACKFTFAFLVEPITVGSSTSQDDRSGFSNYGSCVDIFAPGSRILSANHTSNSGTRIMSGTSMAAPHVAGAAALILEANPELSCAGVKRALKDQAEVGAISDLKGSPNLLLNVA